MILYHIIKKSIGLHAILGILRIVVPLKRRGKTLKVVHFLLGRTQAKPICISCRLYRDIEDEAPRSKLRGIKAELRRSQPVFALAGFAAVRPAIHPCSKLQGILAKANKTILDTARVEPTAGLRINP